MSYEHRLVEAANGREFYDKIGRDADAQIAALTEKLRAVEAERDADAKIIADLVVGMDSWAAQEDHEIYADAWPAYCNARARLVWEFADQKPSGTPPKVPKLSALRAELERKDAALRKYADSANYSNGYYGEVTWCGAMDGEEDAPWNIARAALHPKEPPCQTA